MIYQDFQGMKLSNLGLGCMRLPVADGNDAVVDQAAVEEMVALAMERGVNYYDTAWAFRFLQRIPNVTVILSGMSNLEQLKDNLATFETEDSLTKEEWDGLLALGGEMTNPKALACAACRYCTSHCPQGLDIPNLLSLYNEHCFTQGGFIAPMALSAIPADKQPSACIGCRSCEAVCPQGIKISEAMADFTAKLGG